MGFNSKLSLNGWQDSAQIVKPHTLNDPYGGVEDYIHLNNNCWYKVLRLNEILTSFEAHFCNQLGLQGPKPQEVLKSIWAESPWLLWRDSRALTMNGLMKQHNNSQSVAAGTIEEVQTQKHLIWWL